MRGSSPQVCHPVCGRQRHGFCQRHIHDAFAAPRASAVDGDFARLSRIGHPCRRARVGLHVSDFQIDGEHAGPVSIFSVAFG